MKTNKAKKGPLGTPLGNPLGYFNSQKAKRNQPLNKAQNGMSFKNTYEGPLTESDSKRLDKEFPSTATQIPYAPNKPNMGYGSEDMYRQKEADDRAAYTNYLKSPAANLNNKLFKTGLQPNQSIQSQEGNAEATKNVVNNMNNIDWNSEEGKRYKNFYNKQKLGGANDGITSKTRKTITGGTRTKIVNENTGKVMITKRNKEGDITKQKTRPMVKGWSEDDYKVGGATKAKKFAALAKPFDKVTYADKIAGAKKKMSGGGVAPSAGLTEKKKSSTVLSLIHI